MYISKLAIRYNKKNPTLKIICKTIIWYYYDHSKFSLILKRKYMLENKPLLISRSILTNFQGGTSRQILALNKFMFHCTNIKTRKFLFFSFNIVYNILEKAIEKLWQNFIETITQWNKKMIMHLFVMFMTISQCSYSAFSMIAPGTINGCKFGK